MKLVFWTCFEFRYSNLGLPTIKSWAGGWVIKVNFSVTIPDWVVRPFTWLVRLVVWLAILYRRLRYGYAFRRIPLTQGKYAIVDPEDYEHLKKYKWYARKSVSTFYAVCYISEPKYLGRRNVYMHQLVINVPAGMDCDHINHDGLDNRKANLRAVTHAQNLWNRRKSPKPSRSKYIGIDWKKGEKLWRSRISVYGKCINLGYFHSEIEAAKAYDEAAKKYHGEFAVLNFETKRHRGTKA